jgi:hypothetical protein
MATVGSTDAVDSTVAVKERLEAFAGAVLADAVNRPVQLRNGGVYLRGLLEQGPRTSLEPLVARLGGEADYESLQQFVAVSPWDPALVVKAVAERVAPAIDIQAWVLDDTGFPNDGTRSPGVKRQYSQHLGKDRQLSDRRVGACGRRQGDGAARLGAVSARGVVCGSRAPPAGKDPGAGHLFDQARARSGTHRARRQLGCPSCADPWGQRRRREHRPARAPA